MPGSALSNGAHSISVKSVNSIGNASASSDPFDFTIDVDPPAKPAIVTVHDDVGAVTGYLTHGGVTDDVKPEFKGKAEVNSTVIIKDLSVEIGRVQTDANGNWTFTPGIALTTGVHTISATAVDLAGNASTPSEAFVFTIGSAPVIVGITDDTGWVQGPVANGTGVTNDRQPMISGTAGVGDTVTLRMYSGAGSQFTVVGTVIADARGQWSIADNGLHVDGRVRYEASAVTSTGSSTGTSASYEITFDFVAPPVPKNIEVTSGSVIVSFDSSTLKIGDKVLLSVNGVVEQYALTQQDLTKSSCTFTVAGASTKTISAGLMDAAGNTSNHLTTGDARYIDFEKMAPMRAKGPSILDLGPATIHWEGKNIGQTAWPAGIIEKGFLTGEGFLTPSIGLGVWGGNYLTLDDGDSSSYFSMTYGELTFAMNLFFVDGNGVVVHTVAVPITGGPNQANFSTTLTGGKTYSKVIFSTDAGQYVWIDNVDFGISGLREIAAPNPPVKMGAYFEGESANLGELPSALITSGLTVLSAEIESSVMPDRAVVGESKVAKPGSVEGFGTHIESDGLVEADSNSVAYEGNIGSVGHINGIGSLLCSVDDELFSTDYEMLNHVQSRDIGGGEEVNAAGTFNIELFDMQQAQYASY